MDRCESGPYSVRFLSVYETANEKALTIKGFSQERKYHKAPMCWSRYADPMVLLRSMK